MTVAVIGAGAWGKNLVKNFHALGVLSAVAEASPVHGKAVAAQFPDVQVFTDYRQVLEGPWPAVAIATPVATHFQIAKEALCAGKDVFVEKPITISAAEADELVELAKERAHVLMVGHLLLYQPAVQFVKSYLDSGALGTIASLHQERLNLGKARSVENALWSLGVHDVAVLLYLVGESPSEVQASGQRVLQETIEDDVYMHMLFPNGVQGHLHSAWLWPEKRRRLTIVGTKGMIIYDEADQTLTLHRKHINSDLANVDQGQEVIFQGSGEPLKLELEHFLACVANRGRPISDGFSGAEVVRVLETAQKLLIAQRLMEVAP